MAHAGTPTGLAKQPATSTINGLWQALLVAVVLFALVAGMVFVATNLAAKGFRSSRRPTKDTTRSRGLRGGSHPGSGRQQLQPGRAGP